MSTSSTHVQRSGRQISARARRVALAATVVAAVLTPVVLAEPSAAAPTPSARVVLHDVSGTRVARGGAPGVVTATAVNEGLTPATGVSVRYQLPPAVSFAAAASSPGCTVAGTLVTCVVGTLAAGQSAPVAVGVTEPSVAAVLGTRTGYFLPPTTDQLDLGAGELEMRTWFHESGAEGTDLSSCWPIDLPSPLMDVAGGTCDGTPDAAELDPDTIDLLGAFPEPYSEPLVRSWEFRTEVTAPGTGDYRACGVMIDDGGYLALAPVGDTLDASTVRVSVVSYDSGTSAPFTLVGGARYQVVMRVSNRGFDGVDNGANGGTLAGWEAYGLAPADEPCDAAAAGAFGTADSAWVTRSVADVVVVGSSDLTVAGAVESGAVDGRRTATVRVANHGPDAARARVAIELPQGSSLGGTPTGCDWVDPATPATCELDSVTGTTVPTAGPRVVSYHFDGPAAGSRWRVQSDSSIDVDPSDNTGSFSGAGS